MDDATFKHFCQWVSDHVPEHDVDRVIMLVPDFVRDNPEYLETHGWREILDRAEYRERSRAETKAYWEKVGSR